jgi:non-homologous end joining protein Ku
MPSTARASSKQYVCVKKGVVVERSDMVKGYEFAKDQ